VKQCRSCGVEQLVGNVGVETLDVKQDLFPRFFYLSDFEVVNNVIMEAISSMLWTGLWTWQAGFCKQADLQVLQTP
jgi:hypothetical protein